MITRPSRGGFCTAIPTPDDPDVFIWAGTETDAEYMAHRDNLEHMRAMESERVRLEREFAEQALREYEQIRARA